MDESIRILVVDDERSMRKTLRTILEEQGYFVDTAENGKEAVEKSRNGFYNLALVDIRLPDTEGTKLLTAMTDTRSRMVKITITGYPSLQNAINAVNQGADAYIQKPFNAEDYSEKSKPNCENNERKRSSTKKE